MCITFLGDEGGVFMMMPSNSANIGRSSPSMTAVGNSRSPKCSISATGLPSSGKSYTLMRGLTFGSAKIGTEFASDHHVYHTYASLGHLQPRNILTGKNAHGAVLKSFSSFASRACSFADNILHLHEHKSEFVAAEHAFSPAFVIHRSYIPEGHNIGRLSASGGGIEGDSTACEITAETCTSLGDYIDLK